MTVLTRDNAGLLTATSVVLPDNLKLKIFRDGFRTRFCEALLARRVIVVEVRRNWSPTVLWRVERLNLPRRNTSGSMHLGGCPSTRVAKRRWHRLPTFFRGLGKTVATIFDQQQPEARAAIVAACHAPFEQPYAGFEHMLQAEVSPAMQAWFVQWFAGAGEWPPALAHLIPHERVTGGGLSRAVPISVHAQEKATTISLSFSISARSGIFRRRCWEF